MKNTSLLKGEKENDPKRCPVGTIILRKSPCTGRGEKKNVSGTPTLMVTTKEGNSKKRKKKPGLGTGGTGGGGGV